MRSADVLYPLSDVLVSINVPNDEARAVVDAMERDVATRLATRPDLESPRAATQSDLALPRQSAPAGFVEVCRDLNSDAALLDAVPRLDRRDACRL